MLKILNNIIRYNFFYYFNKLKTLPFSLTINLTNKCDLRCKTCNIWENTEQELTLDEYRELFKNINSKIFFITLTGGEIFLRKDISDIIIEMCKHLKPNFLNIPTNGMLTDIIFENIKIILENCKNTKIKINISIDGDEKIHNYIRGAQNSFENAVKTYCTLKKINNKNLTIGIGTTISKYNVENYREIWKTIDELSPPSFVFEPAQIRIELNNAGGDILPEVKKYKIAEEYLVNKIKEKYRNSLFYFIRKKYYQNVMRTLSKNKQIISCYAGISSCYITSSGDVWNCCVRGECFGNLKKENFDFKKIWYGEIAQKIRYKIKKEKCFCVMSNIYYNNIMVNPFNLL